MAPTITSQSEIPRQHRTSYFEAGSVGIVDAAKYLGVTVSSMHHMRRKGNGPICEMVPGGKSGVLKYRIDDLKRYKESPKIINVRVQGKVSTSEAAKIIGITKGHLSKLQRTGNGPPAERVGNTFYYAAEDIEAFMIRRESEKRVYGNTRHRNRK